MLKTNEKSFYFARRKTLYVKQKKNQHANDLLYTVGLVLL